MPPWAKIVRGTPSNGKPMSVDHVKRDAARTVKFGFHGISIRTFPAATSQEIATRGGIPHMYFCVVRYWVLLDLGLTVSLRRLVPRQAQGHGTIVFPQAPTDHEIAKLIESLGQPMQNLTGEPRKK